MGSRVLIMDYSTDRASGALISRWIPRGWTAEVFRPDPGASFPDPRSADRVIHSGSALSICDDAPFQDDAGRFIRDAVQSGIPQMGICYGHQLLVRTVAGRAAVRRNPAGIEAGWLEVMFDPEASAVIGVPRTIRIFHSHFDEAVTLPEGAAVLAWSTRTMVQAFVDERRMLFGCQFHPEFDRDAGNLQFSSDRELLSRNGLDWEEMIGGGPDPATDGRFFRFFLERTWRGAGG